MAQLALLATYAFVFWLMRKDMKQRVAGSWILLIPGMWIAFQGSRPLSFWIGGAETGDEANLLDTATFAAMLLGSIWWLKKKSFNWGSVFRNNNVLFLLYIYFAIGVMWSDLPALSLKRIVKDFGCVLVGLVFLTQKNPAEAIRATYVRVAYILFLFSVVFIKYFPSIGRQARGSGDNMFRGVAPHKNTLGQMVFVFSVIIIWDLMELWKRRKHDRSVKGPIRVRIFMLLVGVWLLKTCDSQTSMLCLLMGIAIFWITSRLLRMSNGKTLLTTGLAVVITMMAMDKTFNISAMVIKAMGRNPTLTGRTEIWRDVLAQGTDPLLGNGFYIFWDTQRGATVVEDLARIKSTHNGYIEVYVDGGMVAGGLLFMLLLIMGGRVVNRLFDGHPFGAVGLIFWFTAIVYNFSESSFFRLDSLWFALLMMTINCPSTREQRRVALAASEEPVPSPSVKSTLHPA